MTINQIVEKLKQSNPLLKVGTAKGTAVGFYDSGQWWPLAVLAINGMWVRVDYVPRINGQDVYSQTDWMEA